MRSIPWSTEMPIRWPSTTSLNSGPTGGPDSFAIIFIASVTGRPDLRPRTITSMASAKSFRKTFCRRVRRNLINHRGKPRKPTIPEPAQTYHGKAKTKGATAMTMPATSDHSQNMRIDRSIPDCAIRVRKLSFFLRCFSRSPSWFNES